MSVGGEIWNEAEMPEQFERIDKEWSARRAAWEAHCIAKGTNRSKACALAAKKRNKASWPACVSDRDLQ